MDIYIYTVYIMNTWSEKWLLKFHPEKCKTMRKLEKVKSMNINIGLKRYGTNANKQ